MFETGEAELRSNSLFRLVPFDQLESPDQHTFQSLKEEPSFYGLLVPPPGSALPVKSVSHDAALLFLTLREPARVPHLLAKLFGTSVEHKLRELILDGIFEIKHAESFISGAAALPLLGGGADDRTTSPLAQLSLGAISYASALEGLSVRELATRLYMFNRAPSTPQLLRQFANDSEVIGYLVDHSRVGRQLEQHWVREISQDAWFLWRRAAPPSRYRFKLYVSPLLDSLRPAFEIAVDTFVKVKCEQFKVGRTAFGLLRPDKLVAYFSSLDQVHEAAELIRASAAGLAAQGVPFTATIDPDGLVSWGMDPPRLDQVLTWQEHQSWRQWLSQRIAVYTLAAKEAGANEILKFVLQRVNLDGVDAATWTPNLSIWRGRAGTEEEVA
jgi:hypothetical protein